MGSVWSKERAWEWYNARTWLRGCNYMSADCANRVDQWQSLGFEERFETTKQELKLMQETGYNTVRLIPEFVVWKEEHDGFMERFERYLALLDSFGISAMIVLANDCMPPKNEYWKMPQLGKQEWVLGYHGGKEISLRFDATHEKEMAVFGSNSTAMSSWDIALDLLYTGKVDIGFAMSLKLPLDEWKKGFDAVIDKSAFKVLLYP